MDSPTDGWLVPDVLPLQVLHYDGTTWRQSPLSEHAPAYGMVSVFDSSDAWNIGLINGVQHPEVTGTQHYVNGQWQTVQ